MVGNAVSEKMPRKMRKIEGSREIDAPYKDDGRRSRKTALPTGKKTNTRKNATTEKCGERR